LAASTGWSRIGCQQEHRQAGGRNHTAGRHQSSKGADNQPENRIEQTHQRERGMSERHGGAEQHGGQHNASCRAGGVAHQRQPDQPQADADEAR
jgi:ribosomal protein L4